MAVAAPWTRDQLLIAFTLYSQLPFGKLHSRNPDIIHYAGLIDRTPSALAMKLVNFASLDPFITGSGRVGLSRVSKADRDLWQEMDQDPQAFEQQCRQALDAVEKSRAPVEAEEISEDFSGGERMTAIKTRIGQQLFRKRVLNAYGGCCCVTGLDEPSLLIASHIRPWKAAVEHRLNPSNGLCLSMLYDRAFDLGLITFNDQLEMLLSTRIRKLKSPAGTDSFARYEGKTIRLPDQYPPDMAQMSYHRRHIFLDRH